MAKILLFVPFYNCERQILRVLKQVKKHHQYFDEVLLVDNRSQDKSLSEAQEAIKELNLSKITLVRNVDNYNLGGSHKVAFNYAVEKGFDHLVVLHGDDQGSLDDLVPLLEKNEHQHYDCLLGARFHPDSKLLGYSKFRTFGNIVVNTLCALACRRKILDMGSGLNMYSKKFFSDQRIILFPNDLTFNVFLLFHSCFIESKILFFPLSWREEDQISNAKVFKQFKTILKLIVKCITDQSVIYKTRAITEYKYEIISKT